MIGRNTVFHPLSFCISSLLVFSSLPQWGVVFEQSTGFITPVDIEGDASWGY